MKAIIMSALTTVALSSFSQSANADIKEERLVLKFEHEHFKGNNIVDLDQEIKDQHDVNINEFSIKRIRLIAKSKNGEGTAKLVLDDFRSKNIFLDGIPASFHDESKDTYSRPVFKLGEDSIVDNRLNIQLRGNIKLLKVVIKVEPNNSDDNLAEEGWDVHPRIAVPAANCYEYDLVAFGGKATARIYGLPDQDYIQTNSRKRGFVCFNGRPILELSKLADTSMSVRLTIKGLGEYHFQSGDAGSRYINHWYRKSWYLNQGDQNPTPENDNDIANEGWDIDPEVASRSSNCYRYIFEALGGHATARIYGIPGINYIQTSDTKEGWVCFNGSPKLELSKFERVNMFVSLYIEGYGGFNFHTDDVGTRFVNDWYSKYWDL